MDNIAIMPPAPDNPPAVPNQATAKPSFHINNVIAAVFILYLFSTIVLPQLAPSSLLGAIIGLAVLPMGVLAGISFLSRMIKLTDKKPGLRVLGFLVGVGGAIFLFFLTLISGIIGMFTISPPRGT